MTKAKFFAAFFPVTDVSAADLLATAMRHLANTSPPATGATVILPDGTTRYICREEAERFTFGPPAGGRS